MKPGPDLEPEARLKAVNAIASDFSVNPDSKASHYVRSGREMLRMASNYEDDNNPENAYILYMRFLTMFLDKLRNHPGFKELPPSEKKKMNADCNKTLPKAESLRNKLLEIYEAENENHKRIVEDKMRLLKIEQEKEQKLRLEEERYNAFMESAMSQKPSASPSPKTLRGNEDKQLSNVNTDINGYPWNTLDPLAKNVLPPAATSILPNVSYSRILDGEDNAGSSQPQFDRSMKPNRFLSPMSSGLRQVVVPGDLISVFEKCAEKNTKNNIETCGFLTGKIMNGKLVITDLIIPKQDGGPDSCTTRGEEEYFQIQDKYDLISFGWIHTHPTQTAFLSSVDMHSQYWYQQMMPEAIAIVCAPQKGQIGWFSLNPVEGMEVIGKCKATGFHQHPQISVPLFVDATHHIIDSNLKVKIHDIR